MLLKDMKQAVYMKKLNNISELRLVRGKGGEKGLAAFEESKENRCKFK